MTTFETIRSAARKRALYRRTVFAIRNMPEKSAEDIGIDRRAAKAIARRSVYGD